MCLLYKTWWVRMKLDDFSALCKARFDAYFKDIELKVKKGMVLKNGRTVKYVYYPTMILCIESEGRIFSVELLGVSKERKSLKVKKRDGISIRELTSIHRGNIKEQCFFIFSGDNVMGNMIFYDHNVLKLHDSSKHPFLDKFKVKFVPEENVTQLLNFKDDFTTGMIFDCVLAYENNGIFRSRYIFEMMFFTTNTTVPELDAQMNIYMKRIPGSLYGVRCLDNIDEESWVKASYLLNLILNDKIHETTIGDYLNDHPDIICKALGYDSIIYEPNLKWIDKTDDNLDQFINPDALLKRADGNYDICDFKKGLLKRKKVTRGERNRRRFIDDVDEGLAQLDNYEEYFSYQKNKDYAKSKYGVNVDCPKKILIIGNIENTIHIEVEQALRGRSNTFVIDYDLLISYYYNSLRS